MSLGIVLLVALVVAVFYIKRKVDLLHKTFDKKLELISRIASHPAESAADIGASLAEAALAKVKSALEGSKKK